MTTTRTGKPLSGSRRHCSLMWEPWVQWKAYRASRRIARRAESHTKARSSVDTGWLKDVRDEYPDDIVLRLDALQQQYRHRLLHLPEVLDSVARNWHHGRSPITAEEYGATLDHLERLNRTLIEVEQAYGDASCDGYALAISSALDIITPVAKLCVLSDEWEVGISHTQQQRLLTLSFLRMQRDEWDSEEPLRVSLVPAGGVPVTPDQWLAAKAIRTDDDPLEVLREYEDRAEQRRVIWQTFNIQNVPDQMCDYPDDLIQKLYAIRNTRIFRIIVNNAMQEGAPESQIRELIRFGRIELADPARLFQMVRNLGRHPYSPALPVYPDYSQAPSPVPEQCEALVSVAMAYMDEGKSRDYLDKHCAIADPRMVQLLIANPEKGDRIAKVIRERHIYDYESLEQLSETVLSEGML